MTSDELTSRVERHLTDTQQVGFAPLVLAALMGIVSAVSYWLTQRCLNKHTREEIHTPGAGTRHSLRRLIRWAGRTKASELIEATGTDVHSFLDDYGNSIEQAFLNVAAQATSEELAAVCAGEEPVTLADLPPDA